MDGIEVQQCNRRCGFGDSQIFAASPFSPLAPDHDGSPQPGPRDTGSGRKRFGRDSISLPTNQASDWINTDLGTRVYMRPVRWRIWQKAKSPKAVPFDDAVKRTFSY
jgi:hypothetical protein